MPRGFCRLGFGGFRRILLQPGGYMGVFRFLYRGSGFFTLNLREIETHMFVPMECTVRRSKRLVELLAGEVYTSMCDVFCAVSKWQGCVQPTISTMLKKKPPEHLSGS